MSWSEKSLLGTKRGKHIIYGNFHPPAHAGPRAGLHLHRGMSTQPGHCRGHAEGGESLPAVRITGHGESSELDIRPK